MSQVTSWRVVSLEVMHFSMYWGRSYPISIPLQCFFYDDGGDVSAHILSQGYIISIDTQASRPNIYTDTLPSDLHVSVDKTIIS